MTTQPAQLPADPRAKQAYIEPSGFRAPAGGVEIPRPRVPWAGALALLLLVCVVWAAWFVLTARSVGITTQPLNASVTVDEWPAPRVGNHWLMRKGPRHVRVQAPGYIDFNDDIEVNESQLQTHEIVLEKLPGHLRVSVVPRSGARILVDGAPAGDVPGVVQAIRAGLRSIEIQAERYQSFQAELEIEGKGIEQSLDVQLDPDWAQVRIDSQPGAMVRIDQQDVGHTPLTTELLSGRRVVELTAPGFKRWKQTLKITAGQAVDLGEIVLQKADGQLALTSIPNGANVTVDGEFRGRTPLRISVTPDVDHKVAVIHEGYQAHQQFVQLDSGKQTSVAVELTPELATIHLQTSPADAELLINGEPRGSATQTLSLPTHEHELTIRARGHATYQTRVTPRKGVEKRFRIRLKTAAEANASAPPENRSQTNASPAREGQRKRSPAKGFVTTFAEQQLKLFTGGRTQLGSSRRSPGHQANEVVREVALERPFYLATKEVTNAEFRRFLANHRSGEFNQQNLDGDAQAVSNITWEAAAMYCNWLSRKDSLPPFYQIKYGEVLGVNPASTGYRLPTEAEWEWAARVAPGQPAVNFPWGDDYPPIERMENYADTSASAIVGETLKKYTDGFTVAAPVGSFQPNLNGLYDMGGNVAEWVHDFYDAAPSSALRRDPLGPPTGAAHVIKGASWAQASLTAMRLSYRDFGTEQRDDLGFRLARYAQ